MLPQAQSLAWEQAEEYGECQQYLCLLTPPVLAPAGIQNRKEFQNQIEQHEQLTPTRRTSRINGRKLEAMTRLLGWCCSSSKCFRHREKHPSASAGGGCGWTAAAHVLAAPGQLAHRPLLDQAVVAS